MTGPAPPPPDRPPRRWPRVLAGAALFVFVGLPLLALAVALTAQFAPGAGVLLVVAVAAGMPMVVSRLAGPDVVLGCVVAGAVAMVVGGGLCVYAISQIGY